MKLCSFGQGTANIFRKMAGLSEATWSKVEENKKEEDDKSHVYNSSSRSIQHHSNQSILYDINPLSITISFIAYISPVKVGNGNRW
jgi:hypothetical protein